MKIKLKDIDLAYKKMLKYQDEYHNIRAKYILQGCKHTRLETDYDYISKRTTKHCKIYKRYFGIVR